LSVWKSGVVQGRLVTLVERVSGITKIEHITQCAAEPVMHAILNMSHAIIISNLTLDNGKEFSNHEKLTEQSAIPVYFADPYSSWQRGTNENTNGLILQYFRKGTDFAKVTDEQVKEVEDMLNNRPRKRLGYRTPNQVWREAMRSGNHSVALNT
jgi:IS30 family transposase